MDYGAGKEYVLVFIFECLLTDYKSFGLFPF